MMQHLVTKVSRRAFFSVAALYRNARCSSMVINDTFSTTPALQRKFENTHKIVCPSNYVKWGSMGFCRTLSSFATGFTPLKAKPLEEIIDIGRAKNKSPEELADIWDDFHLGRGHIDYKARGTQAAPYLTASCYKEFADSKDLVLIRGDVVFTSKLSDDEAKWLLETAQSFYLNDVRSQLMAWRSPSRTAAASTMSTERAILDLTAHAHKTVPSASHRTPPNPTPTLALNAAS
ncbi:hypothetical protein ACS0TY_031410 [Phlomoides rotata]